MPYPSAGFHACAERSPEKGLRSKSPPLGEPGVNPAGDAGDSLRESPATQHAAQVGMEASVLILRDVFANPATIEFLL